MDMSWVEVWSLGQGRSRTYCGIASGVGEFAVDVFSGDTCLSSEVFKTDGEATSRAHALLRRYQGPVTPRQVRPTMDQSASA
jgi:hypothetical protein